MAFQDRADAGRQLAARLRSYASQPGVLVLALPRGGVPVGFEVARALGAPLDVLLVRKLGVPGQEELAMGAIASGGVRILRQDVIAALRISPQAVETVLKAEQRELERREHAYRDDRPTPNVHSKTVILVDDGLATGSTMQAAAAALRQQGPAQLVVAVPVAASSTYDTLRTEVDNLVCVATPEPFDGVGLWYEDFRQTTDEEVCDLLAQASVAQAQSRTA